VATLAVRTWQERFSVLAAGVPAMQPRDAVWSGLEQRLFAPAAAAKPRAADRPLQWLSNLLSGRALASGLAGVLLCVLVLRIQPGLAGLEARSDAALPASYVGLLIDAAGKPAVLASSRRHGHELTIKLLQPLVIPAGKIAQLWALPKDGSAPFPVAVVPDKGPARLKLADSSETLFANVNRLAVSLEPAPARAGDKPSGDFMLSGHCVKLW
jgi:anti-sigma-K factor RskA